MKIFQSSIFRAVCAIVIGVLLVKFPQDGVTWLTMAIGALFLLSGVIALIAYWQAKRHKGTGIALIPGVDQYEVIIIFPSVRDTGG